MTRKQKLTHWEKLLKQQNSSGKSLKKFCDQNHLNYKTALRWRNIIEAMNNDKFSAPVEFLSCQPLLKLKIISTIPHKQRNRYNTAS